MALCAPEERRDDYSYPLSTSVVPDTVTWCFTDVILFSPGKAMTHLLLSSEFTSNKTDDVFINLT